jgi:hypothetical protein
MYVLDWNNNNFAAHRSDMFEEIFMLSNVKHSTSASVV